MAINLIRGRLAKKQSDRFTPKPSPSSDEVKRKIQGVPSSKSQSVMTGGSSRSRGGSSSSSSNAAAERLRAEAEARRKAEEAEKKRQAAEAQQRAKEAAEAKAAAEKAAKEQQRQQRIQQNVQAYLDRTSKTFVDVGERRGIDPRLLASGATGGRGISKDGNKLLLGGRNDIRNNVRTNNIAANTSNNISDSRSLLANNVGMETNLSPSQRIRSNRLSNLYSNVEYIVDTRGEIRETPKSGRTFEKAIFKLESTAQFSDSKLKRSAALAGSGFLSSVGGTVDLGKAVLRPVKTTKDVATGAFVLATDPIQRDLAIKQLKDVSIGAAAKPERTAAFLGTEALQSVILPIAATKTLEKVLDIFTAVGGKKIPVSKVSRTGQNRFPTVKSVDKSLDRFIATGRSDVKLENFIRRGKPQTIILKGDNLASNEFIIQTPQRVTGGRRKGFKEVVTASPQPIKGDVALPSKKGAGGLEDKGIFVAPKGDASLPFLRIRGFTEELRQYLKSDIKFTANLFKAIQPTRPTITQFRVTDVVQLPRKVIKTRGFEKVSQFGKDVLAPKGVAVITKRSELGQGALSKQSFTLPKGTVDSFTGNVLKKDKKVTETGTTELEAVIPEGSRLFFFTPKKGLPKLKGFKEFFTFKGRNVPIIKGKVIATEDIGTISRLKKTGAKEISYDNFVKQKSISDEFLSSTSSSKSKSIPITSQYKVPSSALSADVSKQFSKSSISSKPTSFETSFLKSTPTSDMSTTSFITSSPTSSTSRTSFITSSLTSGTSRFTGGTSIRLPPTPTVPLIPKPIIPKPPIIKREKPDKKTKGYDVFIKEKGKFFKANKQPKNYGAAFNLGASAVDNSAAATFKIKPTKKPAKVSESLNSFLMMKFRQPKQKSKMKITDTFIEKNKHRIDSQGEIKGISAKGWIANRRKNDFNVRL
jgi:hypothetical protein